MGDILLYIAVVLITYFLNFCPPQRHSIGVRFLAITVITVFLCFGYMTGSDWRAYELFYNEISLSGTIADNLVNFEPGYQILSYFFKFCGFGFWPFFILLKIILFNLIVKLIFKYSPDNQFYTSLVSFIVFFGFFLFIDNPMRNLIAVIIYLLSVKYIIERKFLKFLGMIALATSFHATAAIMLATYFFPKIKLRNRTLFFSFLMFTVVLMLWGEQFIQLIFSIFSFVPYFENKLIIYFVYSEIFSVQNTGISVGFLLNCIFFILLLLNRKHIEKLKYGELIFAFSVIYYFLYVIGSAFAIFYRFQLYMCIFNCISLASLIYLFKSRNNQIIYAIFYGLALLLITYSSVTSSYKYIPYTNHLFHITESKTYIFRSNYNHIHSPYKSKE